MTRSMVTMILTFGFITSGLADTFWVQRPDDMVVYWFHDVEHYDDRVRILYSTTPSLQQGQADPEGWRTNVYVVEARADGSVDQRRIFSRNEHIVALLLRRSHDQVFALRAPVRKGEPQKLELWSTRDGSVSSSEPAPHLPGTRGAGSTDLTQSTPTDDGNLFITSVGRGGALLSWYKFSPEGTILGRGEYTLESARLQTGGWFPAHDGGIGLSVQLSLARGAERLATDIDAPVTRIVGGRTLEANVAAETRAMTFDGEGRQRWRSPALERQLMWGGQMQIPNDLPPEENMRQLQEQMRTTESAEIDLGARRTLVELSRYKRNTDGIKQVPGGYGVLATTVANRRLEPPAHGPYYLEISQEGGLLREIYLGAIAEELEAKFQDFVMDEDGLLLAGSRRARGVETQVTRVTPDGELLWSQALEAPTNIDGIAGADPNVWVFGHSGQGPSAKTLLWLEQVEDSSSEH